MKGLFARQFILFLGDCIALLGSFAVGMLINTLGKATVSTAAEQFFAYLPLFILWMIIYYSADLYSLAYAKPTLPFLKRLGIVLVAQAITGVAYFYVFSFTDISPKTDLAVIVIIAIVLLYVWRRLFFSLFSKRFQERVAIVGKNKFAAELSETLRGNPQYGLQDPFVVETASETLMLLKDHPHITTIILATTDRETNNTLVFWYRRGLAVMDIAQAYELFLYKIPIDFIDETWILHKLERRSTFLTAIFQEGIGRLVACIILVLTLPILAIVALCIKIQDGGPILYTQKRVGKFGKSFTLYKFRSMTTDLAINPDDTGAAPMWSTGSGDKRITRIGAFIRKTHIDEIPQMWNVLRGDLALVGPRPERPEFVEKLEREIPHYSLRHIIKPGFTGWAQVKYRYARTVDDSRDKFQFDLFYLKNKNIFLDIGIILKTLQIIFTH